MIEILWHGRGGQGAFTAARLLGAAATLRSESFSLAFPSFGPERRGAPIRAFTKISDSPIGNRSAIEKADFAIYLDSTLFGDTWESELKPHGIALVNSPLQYDNPRIIAIDADGISSSILGRPIPNTVFLGAIAAICANVELEDVKEAVQQYMAPKLHDSNIAIIEEAFRRTDDIQNNSSKLSQKSAATDITPNHPAPRSAAENATTTSQASVSKISRPTFPHPMIPTLHSQDLQHPDYAKNTCFEAGYLTSKNAGWRNIRPVIDSEACTGCLQCYLYCPDGTIFKTNESNDAIQNNPSAVVAVDYDFCKGCGICARICRFDAIRMIPESEATDD